MGVPCIHRRDRRLMVTLEEKIKVRKGEEKQLNQENKWSKGLKMIKLKDHV